ncbi:hypothetical protein [Hymenobacter sp. IS2118]|uniref:hypothetical protein n=1 Tax=Hymenobacter sp. IS2118 TaxID=1505605 RepID=UPI000557E636|nr:hypothetical protein [Hymenobacter sp. IS2118]
MKKSLLALALFAFVGTAAHAQEGPGKDSKKATASTSPKATCAMGAKSMAAGSCCMKGAKTAGVKPAAKPAVVVKL